MANVPMNANRRQGIIHRLKQTFERRIDDIDEKLKHPSFGEAVYHYTYSPLVQRYMVQLQEAAPVLGTRTFLRTAEGITAVFPKAVFPQLDRDYTLGFPLNPRKIIGYPPASWGSDAPHTEIAESNIDFLQIVALLVAKREIEKERDGLATTIDGLLMKCSTLRQAIEVWPTVLNFIDDETRAQYNKPVKARLKAIKEELALTDDTKVALIKASMLK